MDVKFYLKNNFVFRTFRYIIKRNAFNKYIQKKFHDKWRPIARKVSVAYPLIGLSGADYWWLELEKESFWNHWQWQPYNDTVLWYSFVNGKCRRLLSNKWETYKRFKPYYSRQCVMANSSDLNWIDAAKSTMQLPVIVKPLDSSKGNGVKKFDSWDGVCNYVNSIGDGVVEEFIRQDEQLAQFNCSSVNTLRINTVNYGNGEIEVKWPALRMGRKGALVDNGGAGGVVAGIDVRTGKIIGVSDESRNIYSEHPDSHLPLIGFTIPKWTEACDMAAELAKNIPEAVFVGWDLALSDNGWVMVEANSSPLILWEIAVRRGIRREFNEMRRKVDRNSHK